VTAALSRGTGGRPRAVLVTHVAPDPPWSGERRRTAAAYSHLARHYDCDIAVCRRSRSLASRLGRKLRRPLAPPYAARFCPPDVNFDSYELIWVFELWALSCVPVRVWHRVLWDKDTVMSDGYRRARGFRKRALGYWIWRYERGAAARVRHAFVSFAGDLHRFSAGRLSALPNGFEPPNGLAPTIRAESSGVPRNGHRGGPRLGFVGLLSHEPNRLALMRFATQVLPSLREESDLASTELWVAGGQLGANDARRLATAPGVVVLGYVPRLEDFYAAIDLAIAPMDRGAGTPTKVIEALGHGVPVIGTERALRGLDEQMREWCVEASDSTWTTAVRVGLRLLRTQAPPIDNAYRRYSWSAVFERTVDPLLESADG
jgi:glycosyltransferase involved in cell wall biosynthesis